jgi:hypothetical protein
VEGNIFISGSDQDFMTSASPFFDGIFEEVNIGRVHNIDQDSHSRGALNIAWLKPFTPWDPPSQKQHAMG